MNSYRYVLDQAALKALLGLSTATRAGLIEQFNLQSANSSQQPDFLHRVEGEREVLVRCFRQWQIIYWVDHAVKEVRITDIREVRT